MSYAYGVVYPLIAPKNRFLPFQIVTKETGSIYTVRVILSNFDGSVTKDVSVAFRQAGLTIKQYEDGNNVLSFPGLVDKDIWKEFGLDFNRDFAMADFGGAYTSGEGRGYLTVIYGDSTWYSEVMTFVTDISGCLKLEWYSLRDINYDGGRIAYENLLYSNIMYVRSEIGKPTYEFSEEGEDRNGVNFVTKAISEKTYHFTFLATEPICDAIRIASLSDMVLITDQYGRQYQCDSFLSTPTWQGVGYLASIDCEFQTDTMVVQTGKVNPSLLTPKLSINNTIASNFTIPQAGADWIAVITPNVSGAKLTGGMPWLVLTHLYDNVYRIKAEAGTHGYTYLYLTWDGGYRNIQFGQV